MTIKAMVKAGRLVIDQPTNLPDGTEVQLLPLDPGDWLDDADQTDLNNDEHGKSVLKKRTHNREAGSDLPA